MRFLDRLPRPLDPLRSIKAKLAVLVAANAVVIGLAEYYAVVVFGWRPRYGLIAAVPLTILVTQLLANGMTGPLRQITRSATDLAAGRPAAPIITTSRDEVGELARTFTTMARELASAQQQRRDLLGNVSHELRTPVAALRAQLENLVDGVRAPDQAALGQVLEQVEKLGHLLDDLLDLARAEAGAVPVRRVPVPLEPLLREVAAQVGRHRPDRPIEIRVTPPGLTAAADPGRLAQVVTNLLDNATRHGRSVLVTAAPAPDGGTVLEVTDDGPGIPRERWESVFERFRGGTGEIPQVLGDGQRDGGTGLGLAIARWAVALHGGRIAVVPTGTGRGTRLQVELPAAKRTSMESPDLGHRVYRPGS